MTTSGNGSTRNCASSSSRSTSNQDRTGPRSTSPSCDSGTLYLVLDANDVLREAHTGQKLFMFDEHGNVVDVALDQDEDAV